MVKPTGKPKQVRVCHAVRMEHPKGRDTCYKQLDGIRSGQKPGFRTWSTHKSRRGRSRTMCSIQNTESADTRRLSSPGSSISTERTGGFSATRYLKGFLTRLRRESNSTVPGESNGKFRSPSKATTPTELRSSPSGTSGPGSIRPSRQPAWLSPPETPRRPDLVLKTASLTSPCEGWPAGTVGAIVEAFADGVLLEVVNDEGDTLAMLPVRHDALLIQDDIAPHQVGTPCPA